MLIYFCVMALQMTENASAGSCAPSLLICIKIMVKKLAKSRWVFEKMRKIKAKSRCSIYCTACAQKVTVLSV